MPIAGSAQSKSPSQARAIPPSPTARRISLTTPLDASSQDHMMPAATSGMTCGMKSTTRATVAIRVWTKPRMVFAVNRPSATGITLKNTSSSKAWSSEPHSTGLLTSST